MARRFDPATLFETWKRPNFQTPYPTDEAELDAVSAGTKGMSMMFSAIADLAPRGSELAYYLRLAAARGLAVVLDVEPDGLQVRVFIARPQELWRVPAFNALWATAFADGRWSDGAENMMSHLLGYTAKQRAAWLTAHRKSKPAWTSSTVYALLDRARREVVESVGRRCFGAEPLTVFVDHDVLKPKALSLIPRGMTLARVGLDWPVHTRILGHGEGERTVSKKRMPALNAGLLSNVQFLTRAGWR